MLKKLFFLAACATLVGGCTPSLEYSEISPNLATKHIATAVLLPFTNSMGLENANDYTNTAVLNSVTSAGIFQKIIDPGQVKASMMQYPSVIDAVTRFRTTWTATGTADPKLATWIAKAFNADSIIFGEVTAWNKTIDYNRYSMRSGLAMRWIDGKTGEPLWKMSYTGQRFQSAICIFDCTSLEKTMDDAVDLTVKNWPPSAK